MTTRVAIPQFQLANPLYKNATVAFMTVANGVKTSTLAHLFEVSFGISELPNPQKLNSQGRLKQQVYIEDDVIGVITGISVPSHDTAIIGSVASAAAAAAAATAAAAEAAAAAAAANALAAAIAVSSAQKAEKHLASEGAWTLQDVTGTRIISVNIDGKYFGMDLFTMSPDNKTATPNFPLVGMHIVYLFYI